MQEESVGGQEESVGGQEEPVARREAPVPPSAATAARPAARDADGAGPDREALPRALRRSVSTHDEPPAAVRAPPPHEEGARATPGTAPRGPPRDDVAALAALYRARYRALRDAGEVHVRFLDTFQGRVAVSTNGCTVIAPLLCVQYFTSTDRNAAASPREAAWDGGLPDGLVDQVIDEHAAVVLPEVRAKLGLPDDAFIVPSDVHDHLIDEGLLSTDQFVGVCGGNVLDDDHLAALRAALLPDDVAERRRRAGRKVAATLFFHGHVVALHVVAPDAVAAADDDDDAGGGPWVELLDSLPDPVAWRAPRANDDAADVDDDPPPNAVRVRGAGAAHFDTLVQHYACGKFTAEERRFVAATAWDDGGSYGDRAFDPRVFQAFVWKEAA